MNFRCIYLPWCPQVLLQPQFIKAESLLLTTLKPDPCMVTTVASPTSLATTTPAQSTSLQVDAQYELKPNTEVTQCTAVKFTPTLLTLALTSSCFLRHSWVGVLSWLQCLSWWMLKSFPSTASLSVVSRLASHTKGRSARPTTLLRSGTAPPSMTKSWSWKTWWLALMLK